MIKRIKLMTIAAVLMACVNLAGAQAVAVDEALPAYEKVAGVSGNRSSVGSDTLNNLMALWREAFIKIYPSADITIEGKGSSTAPPALIEGVAQFGPMSRKMKSEESDKFEGKFGYKPTAIGVGLDALAVYVNKDNPIESMTMPQVDAVFSSTRKGGYPNDVVTWGQLNLTGEWAERPISLYGRNSASGTYGFFKEHALSKGDYKNTVKEQPGSASVVQGVTEDMSGIGYSGMGYKTSGVKFVSLATADGETAYEPTYENVLTGHYPLGRTLYIYVVKDPSKPLDPMVKEFMKFILSKEGQQIVVKDGYLPLPEKVAAKYRAMLD